MGWGSTEGNMVYFYNSSRSLVSSGRANYKPSENYIKVDYELAPSGSGWDFYYWALKPGTYTCFSTADTPELYCNIKLTSSNSFPYKLCGMAAYSTMLVTD